MGGSLGAAITAPSPLLGETQLSRVEHTAIVSTICYEAGPQPTNQPTDHTNVFQTFSHPFRFAALVLRFPPLIGVFGWGYSWGHIVMLVRFQPGSMIIFGDRTLQLVFPSWRYAPILCLEVDRHSSLGAAWSDLELDTGARFYALLIYSSVTHTQCDRVQARFMAPNWPAITPRLPFHLQFVQIQFCSPSLIAVLKVFSWPNWSLLEDYNIIQ